MTRESNRAWFVPLLSLLVTGTLLGLSANLAKMADGVGLVPVALLTWSLAGSTVVLSATQWIQGGRLPWTRRRLEYSLIASLVGVVGPNLLLYQAVTRVGAGTVALALALPPLFTYVGARVFGLEGPDRSRATGTLLALVGVIYIATRKLSGPGASPVWMAAVFLAPVLLAVGNLYRTLRWPAGARPRDLAPGLLAVSTGLLVVAARVLGLPLDFPAHEPAALWLVLAQTAAFSVQYLLFFVLQKTGGPVYLSLLGSVAAVVGVPLAVMLGEAPPEGLALGGVLIAAGILLLTRGTRQNRPPSPWSPRPIVAGVSDPIAIEGGMGNEC